MAAPLAVPSRAYHSRVLPLVEIRRRQLQLMTHEMSPIARGFLKRPIANIEAERDRIVAAIDLLFVGS